MLVKLKLKYIQSLGQKKFRQQEGVFIAEGPKLVAELLALHSSSIIEIFALNGWISANDKITNKTEVFEVSVLELEKISQLTTPNQVLAIVKQFDINEPIVVKNKIVLALDTIQDPGNMGTIIRIADWFGIDQIVSSTLTADIYNPKVIQSTMGSIARVKVYYTELAEWLSTQKKHPIYAAMLDGEDVTEMNKIKEGILIVGNESKGISEPVLQFITNRITIPQKARLSDSFGQGKAESLNAAVATGIILSHLV